MEVATVSHLVGFEVRRGETQAMNMFVLYTECCKPTRARSCLASMKRRPPDAFLAWCPSRPVRSHLCLLLTLLRTPVSRVKQQLRHRPLPRPIATTTTTTTMATTTMTTTMPIEANFRTRLGGHRRPRECKCPCSCCVHAIHNPCWRNLSIGRRYCQAEIEPRNLII